MRVLHVIPSVSSVHGGPSRAIRTMEEALSTAGVEVATLTTDDDGPGRRLDAAHRPHTANGASRVYVRKHSDFYKFAPAVVPWLWRNITRYDVAHVHALFSFTSTAAAVVCRLRGVPYVLRPLGTLTDYGLTKRRPLLKRLSMALIERHALRHAGAVHFTSREEQEQCERLGIAISGVIIPLGVDMPDAGRAIADAGRAETRILLLSRIDPVKNVEALLDAFASATRRRDGLRLVVAGSGEPNYVAQLKARSDSLGIADHVDWLGHVAGAGKVQALSSADVFVLPSFSENFGIAAVEAMAAGLPCILGRGVGIAMDAVKAGAAIAVEPDAPSIAEALNCLVADPGSRRAMGEAAREHVRQSYSTAAMARRLIALYAGLCGRRTGVAG